MSSNPPKKRLKAAESRRALLDAGLELLQTRGVAPGLDRVTLKDAIELSGVPRSTAYRLYEGGEGQLEAFRADLLSDLQRELDMEPTVSASSRVIEENGPRLESGDSAEYAAVLREVVRVALQTNVDSLNTVEWRIYMSSLAAAGSGFLVDPEEAELFRVSAAELNDRFVPTFNDVAGFFGLRVKPPLSMTDFAAVAGAAVEGAVLRQQVEPRIANIKRPTGPDGALQSWHAAAITFEALLLNWFEADPAAPVSADLSEWTSFC